MIHAVEAPNAARYFTALQQFEAQRRRICAPLICEWVKPADGRMLTSSREHNLEK